MKISYFWLKELIGGNLPDPEKLADLLTKHSFETEVFGKSGKDTLLGVDVLPNRAHDCLCHQEIAREAAALLRKPFGLKDYDREIKPGSELTGGLVKVEVKDSCLCPRYTARAIVDVKVGPSPAWMQERLKACGLRPISNVVDIVNYVMLETGQPMHAFDLDKLEGGKIIVRRAKKGEKIVSLDDEEYELNKDVLVIADSKNPVAIAGIKGGKNPEVDSHTTKIILEAANFDLHAIRRASQKLKLKTDASWRFEHELDPSLTEYIDRAVYLIQEIAHGRPAKGRVDLYPKKSKPKAVSLEMEKMESLLGVEVAITQAKDILERLGFETRAAKGCLKTVVPLRRKDISLPEDLIEEVGRVYGLEKIPSQMPVAALIPPPLDEELACQNKVKDILSNLGFSEVYNYSFVGEGGEVEVLNPLSQEQKYLRSNLAGKLAEKTKENSKYFDLVRLFEIGKVFYKKDSKVMEKKKIAAAIFPADFYRLKGLVETLLNKLRISDVWYDDEFEKNGNQAKRAEVKVGNEMIGWLGDEVFELDFERLVELATEERVYSPPSKYPAVVRDLALIAERTTKVAEILNLINAAGGKMVVDVDLFDIYEGEKIEQGKKSLAFRLVFQADDHTLTDQEIGHLQEKIIKTLEQEGGWEVRRRQ